jgi:type II secretory pathway pseudopilin PulG
VSGRGRRLAGFSYVEVLVATALLALALVPALEALEIGVRGGGVHEAELALHYRALAALEEVLAQPFGDLQAEATAAAGAASAYSDPPGTVDRRLVYLSGHDADGDSVDDPGLLRVRVEIEATAHVLETLTTP